MRIFLVEFKMRRMSEVVDDHHALHDVRVRLLDEHSVEIRRGHFGVQLTAPRLASRIGDLIEACRPDANKEHFTPEAGLVLAAMAKLQTVDVSASEGESSNEVVQSLPLLQPFHSELSSEVEQLVWCRPGQLEQLSLWTKNCTPGAKLSLIVCTDTSGILTHQFEARRFCAWCFGMIFTLEISGSYLRYQSTDECPRVGRALYELAHVVDLKKNELLLVDSERIERVPFAPHIACPDCSDRLKYV